MLLYIVTGLLAGGLLASLLFNFYLMKNPVVDTWAARAHAAERQLQDVLDRISASDRIELTAAPSIPMPDPTAIKYIPDTQDADARWNEWRGEPPEEIE